MTIRSAGLPSVLLLCVVNAAGASPVGGGPSLGLPETIVVDPAGRLIVGDRGVHASVNGSAVASVLTIDPVDGTRTILSDLRHGSGPAFFGGPDLVREPDGTLIYGLTRLDPVTGERTRLPSGLGPQMDAIDSATLDPEGTLVAVTYRGLFRINPVTAFRTFVSGCPVAAPPCVPRGSGPAFNFPHAIAVAPDGTYYAGDSDGLKRVDPVTGDRTLLSGPTLGGGPALGSPTALIVEASGHLLWSNPTGVLRIDPATGDRAAVSGETRGGGPLLRTVQAMALEPAGTLVLADADLGAVVRVDLGSGDRTIVSGGPIGTGPRPDCVTGIDRAADGAVVISDCKSGVWRIDLQTGDRTVVSGPSVGAGPAFLFASDVAVEPSGNLLVTDGAFLKRVNIANGDRTQVADGTGAGGFREAISVAVEDAGHALVADFGVDVLLPILRFGFPIYLYNGVVRIDLATGRGEVVSGGGFRSHRRGDGPGFFLSPVGPLALETPGTAAVARDADVLRVDLATGDRTVVSGSRRGGGVPSYSMDDIWVESPASWLGVQTFLNRLVRIDTATGDRVALSDETRGSGPQFEYPCGVLAEPEGTVIVVSRGEHGSATPYPLVTVTRVDPATGDRTVLSRY